MNDPKTSATLEQQIKNFGVLSPFMRMTEDGKAAMIVFKCIRFDCDYISSREGFCGRHQTELVAFVFVMK